MAIQDEPVIIKRKLDVNYKVFGKKKADDSIMNAGSIIVSAVFRPVAAVEKSGKSTAGHTDTFTDAFKINILIQYQYIHTAHSAFG